MELLIPAVLLIFLFSTFASSLASATEPSEFRTDTIPDAVTATAQRFMKDGESYPISYATNLDMYVAAYTKEGEVTGSLIINP